jgi:hypothetical protein
MNRPGPQNALNFVREGDVFVVTKLDYRILQTQQNKNGQPHFDVVVSVSDYTEDRINPSFLSQSVPSLIDSYFEPIRILFASRHAERSHNLRIFLLSAEPQ